MVWLFLFTSEYAPYIPDTTPDTQPTPLTGTPGGTELGNTKFFKAGPFLPPPIGTPANLRSAPQTTLLGHASLLLLTVLYPPEIMVVSTNREDD